jgi:hypothetical protein
MKLMHAFWATLGVLLLAGSLHAQSGSGGRASRLPAGQSLSSADERPLAPEPDPMMPRHAVYLELAGNSGDRLSLNYELAIWRQEKVTFTARTGVFYFQQKDFSPLKVQREAGDMIFGLHTVYAANSRHRLETGLGVNIRWQKLEGIANYLSSNLVTGSIGYRMLPKDGSGLMLRANLMLIHNAEFNWLEYYVEGQKRPVSLLPWAGVSVGYAF